MLLLRPKRLICVLMLFVMSCSRQSAPSSTPKIIGGRVAQSLFPWFVQLMDSALATEGFCGGTLIADRVVLTAAHCIETIGIKNIYVAMGLADGHQLHLQHPIRVQGMIAHPGYLPSGHKNDLALLYLEDYSDVTFKNPVAPIFLETDLLQPEHSGSSAIVIGLGNTTSFGRVFDGAIREAKIPLLGVSDCQPVYPDFDNTQICAGDVVKGGVDSCHGDSGGPLVSRNQGVAKLIGVVSRGHGCGQAKYPGVYTRVAAFSDFIKQSIEKLSKKRAQPDTAEDLARIITTRCARQFGFITIVNRGTSDNIRETIFSIDPKQFVLSHSADNNKTHPNGSAILEQCDIKDAGRSIHAEWLQVEAPAGSDDHVGFFYDKVAVRVRTESGDVWMSTPQRMSYRQDRLSCATSQGNVTLADLRQTTFVIYKDVMYHFGSYAPEPRPGQTTWGCAISDASVEVYNVKDDRSNELAARIFHRSVGTVTVKLQKVSDQLNISAHIYFDTPNLATLTIENKSKEDLFTWKMFCPASFSVKLASGEVRAAKPSGSGSGFEVVVDPSNPQEGIVRADTSVHIPVQWGSDLHNLMPNCVLNDLISVDVIRD